MKKLVPVLLFTFSATAAFSQTSKDDKEQDKAGLFAESLRQEVLTDIKKKLATDTAMQRSQEAMKEYYRACGVQKNSAKISGGTSTTRVYRIAPESKAIVSSERKGS